jgi:hypothetical protein
MKVDFRIKTSGFHCLLWLGVINAVFSTVTYLGAQIIENPSKPQAANAGRVVTPKEVLAIEDTGEKYYFKYPHNIKIGPDGSIFVIDGDQFLQFDPNGKYLRNLFKKGQGPGEMTNLENFDFEGKNIVAFSPYPAKLIWFDGNGKFIKDESLAGKARILRFLGRIAGRWVFETFDFPHNGGDLQYSDQAHQLLIWNGPDKTMRPLSKFLVRVLGVSAGGASGFFDVGQFQAVPLGDHRLAISHTSEYDIKIFDIESDKVEREFRRSYERVPPPPLKAGQRRPAIMMGDKTYEQPEEKYANDIANILVRGDHLWIVTSTTDKKKGIPIDIFDPEGHYRDSFYMNLSEPGLSAIRSSSTCAMDGNFLFTAERTDEGTFAIKKYKIAE